ncbi:MAG: hypothetical protein ABI370_07990, partial [Gammaproteobacteria bacterium]
MITRNQHLIDLGLIEPITSNSMSYTYAPASDRYPDISKFLNGLPCWGKAETTHTPGFKRKEIVLNDYRYFMWQPIISHSLEEQITELYSLGFTISILTQDGGLIKTDKITDFLNNLVHFCPKANQELKNELRQKGQLEKYYVLDHQMNVQESIEKGIWVKSPDAEILELSSSSVRAPLKKLTPQQLEILINLLNNSSEFSMIKYDSDYLDTRRIPSTHIDHTYTWQNNTSLDKKELLEHLYRGEISDIISLPHINRFLVKVMISGVETDLITTYIDLSQFTQLESLILRVCDCENIIGLDKLTHLKSVAAEIIGFNLHLVEDKPLENILKIKQLKSLTLTNTEYKKITIDHQSLEKVSLSMIGSQVISLKNIAKLNNLMINSAFKLTTIEGLQNCHSLEELTIQYAEHLTNLDLPTNLRKLQLFGLNITKLDVSALKELREVFISACEILKSIQGLQYCQNLETLTCSAEILATLDLAHFPKLKKLIVRGDNYSKIDVSALTQLEELSVTGNYNGYEAGNCPNVIGIEKLKMLQRLTLNAVNTPLFRVSTFPYLKSLVLTRLSPAFNLSAIKSAENPDLEKIQLDSPVALYLDQTHGLKELTSSSHVELHSSHSESLTAEQETISLLETISVYHVPINNKIYTHGKFKQPIFQSESKNQQGSKEDEPAPFTKIVYGSKKVMQRSQSTQSKQSLANPEFEMSIPLSENDEKKSSQADKKLNSSKSKHSKQLDTNTGPSDETLVQRKIFYSSSSFQKDPPISLYRINIYDQIELDPDDGTISLKKAAAGKLTVVTVPTTSATTRGCFTGRLKVNLNPGDYIVLPGLSAADELLAFSDNQNLNVQYSEKTKQYIVSLKPGINEPYAKTLEYKIKPDSNYFKKPHTDITITEDTLPNDIRDALDNYFKKTTNKQLLLIRTTEDITKKLQLINDYCDLFQEIKLNPDDKSVTSDMKINDMIKLLDKQFGVCRHRAFIFMTLCQYFKISGRYIDNDTHAYSEIQSSNGYYARNLGGGTRKVKTLPLPTADLPKSPETKMSYQEQKYASNLPIRNNYHQAFLPDRHWLDECKTFNDLANHLWNKPEPVILQMSSNREAQLYHQALLAYCEQKKTTTVYIDSADDFQTLFMPAKINTTDKTTTTLFTHVDGPIKKLIDKKSGAIIINWSQLSSRDCEIYASMLLAKPPNINGIEIPPGVKIIHLRDPSKAQNPLLKRNAIKPPINLTLSTPVREMASEGKNNDVGPIVFSVNLYHSMNWTPKLLLENTLTEVKIEISVGKLVEAMQAGAVLHIINPPENDDAFERLLYRVKTEGKLIINGEEIVAKKGFDIVTQEIAPEPPLIKNSPETEQKIDPKKILYLHQGNLQTLYRLQYIKGKTLCINEGWLKKCEPNSQLIITEKLTNDQYQELIDSVNALPIINRPFIKFAIPQKPAEPVNVKSFTEIPVNKNMHIQSNDPNFVTHCLIKQLKVPSENVIFLTGLDAWNKLIDSTNLSLEGQKLKAEYFQKEFLTKLTDPKLTLILSGDLSKEDYLKLQTLFCQNPHLQVNGERVDIKATIIWTSKPQRYPLLLETPQLEFPATMKSYQDQLTIEYKPDAAGVEKIEKTNKFLSYVARADFSGRKEPGIQYYNYQKYRDIYLALNSKPDSKSVFSRENPIKSIIHHHYDKDSHHYAYLNAIAKMLFSPAKITEPSVRLAKLNTIKKDYLINKKKYFWKMINCYSGAAMRELMIDSDSLTVVSGEPPLPSDAMISALDKLVTTELNPISGAASIIPSHPKKRMQDKQFPRTASSIQNKKITLLIGESGTGKTFAAKKIAKGITNTESYFGENDILKWLIKGGDLILDEASLEISGKWEFLRGLLLESPVIYYEGKSYKADHHHVTFTSNFLHYPARQLHDLLWDANVVLFDRLQIDFVRETISTFMQELFPTQSDELMKVIQILVNTFQFMLDTPHQGEITLRDMQNICVRLAMKKNQGAEWNSFLTQIISDELSGLLFTAASRKQFVHFLEQESRKIPGNSMMATTIDIDKLSIIPTPEIITVLQSIKDDLALREMRIIHKDNLTSGKLGILVDDFSLLFKDHILTK